MMRGLSRTSRDVPPFCIMDGTHTLRGINVVGLKRAGIPSKSIHALRHAFTSLFGTRQNLKLAIERLEKSGVATPEVTEMLNFIKASKRGVAFGPHDKPSDDSES
jgi:UDP-N-acetylglucosamine acyltransferase